MFHANGLLFKIVELDGSDEGLSDVELDRSWRAFPYRWERTSE
jgi:hypothetical protein